MGTNTVIVEFFGLPACGKSALADRLKRNLTAKGKKAAVWKDITYSFKHATIRQMLGSISVKHILNYIFLFFKLPYSKERKWYMYWFAIKISLLYQYCKKYLDFDFILIDHGILQHTVSMQCGQIESLDEDFKKQLKKILIYEKNVNYCCNCMIDLDTAQQRMLLRKRKSEGRLDAITDNEKLKNMYIKEDKIFKYIFQIAVAAKNDWIFFNLNMKNSVENLATNVELIICPEPLK